MTPIALTSLTLQATQRLGLDLLRETGQTGETMVRLALLEIPEYIFDARTDEVQLNRAGVSSTSYTDERVTMVAQISDGHRAVWTQDAADPSRIRHLRQENVRVRCVIQPLIPGTRTALAADTWTTETVDMPIDLQQALLAYVEWQTRDQYETMQNTDRLSGREFQVEGLRIQEQLGGQGASAATASDNARNRFLQWASRYRKPGGISG